MGPESSSDPSASPRWLVASDLDGTLLDHVSYEFQAARPALELLRRRHVPLVIVTSKTWSEVREFRTRLATPGPTIVENGSALVVEGDGAGFAPMAAAIGSWQNFENGLRRQLAPAYDRILEILHRVRQETGYTFRGFDDMSVAEVAERCGFSEGDAERARDRWCSEPIVWRDSEATLGDFIERLATAGLTLLRGGRFHHVLGKVDKGAALRALIADTQGGAASFRILALGDGPNDRALLAAADVAVVIPNPHSSTPLRLEPGWIEAERPGPLGWNTAVQQVLNQREGESEEKP